MLKNNFIGKDGFVWWIGVVESRHDPLYLGRCKVRIYGWHTANKIDMPTESLPWAYPLMPITSASMTGVGISPTGPVEGTWVMGFFRDGEIGQFPVMMGTFHGIPESAEDVRQIYTKEVGFYDSRMYDGAFGNDVHEMDIDAVSEKGNIRSLKYQKGQFKLNNVPRDPISIIPNFKSGTTIPNGYGVTFSEIPIRDPYPDARYYDEPTTPRPARGVLDSSTNLIAEENGSTIGQGIFNQKEILRKQYFKNIQVPIKYFQPSKTQITVGNLLTVPEKIEKVWEESKGTFNPIYPYNHVHQTESGHLIEYDDTPDSERMHWYHRSGTFTEIFHDGTRVDRIHGRHTRSLFGDDKLKTYGNKYQNVSKSFGLYVNENEETQNNLNISVGRGSSMFVNIEGGNLYFENKGISANESTGLTEFETDIFHVKATTEIILDSPLVTVNGEIKDLSITPTVSGETATVDTKKKYVISSESMKFVSSSMLEQQHQSISKNVYHQDWEYIQNSLASGPVPGSQLAPVGPIGKRISVGIGDAVIETLGGATGSLGNIYLLAGSGVANQAVEAKNQVLSNPLSLKRSNGIRDYTTSAELFPLAKSYIGINSFGLLNMEASLLILLGRAAVQPVLKGPDFITEYLQHNHSTGTGPSGPVTNAQPYLNTLSRKVFTE